MKNIALVLGALAVALALAACSRAAPARASELLSESAEAPAEKSRAADTADEAAGAGSGPGNSLALPQARMVIKTASLSIRVKDVAVSYEKALRVAEASGGFIQSSTRYREEGERAQLTIRVPPTGFLPLLAALEALGKTSSKSISGEDVTEEYYDLSAELENQLEVRARLVQLLRQAKKVEEAIAVEQQLERIGSNVNRIKGRMKYLETMVGMSTVTLEISPDAPLSAEPFLDWRGIGRGFVRAAQILVQSLFVVLQVLVVAIPLAAILGAAVWGAILLARAARARGLTRSRGTTWEKRAPAKR
jgi:hypothetical protein